MSNAPTAERIELPREEGESARAYAARVEYILAGPDRSLDKTRQKLGKDSPGYTRTLAEWSSQYGWAEHARRYDDLIISMRTQEAAEQYRKDLEAHRKKAMDAGRSLFQVAGQLLQQLNDVLRQPKKIEGKDGRIYTIHAIELNSTTLAIAGRALTAALDLEAHALGVDKLLPTLGTDDSE